MHEGLPLGYITKQSGHIFYLDHRFVFVRDTTLLI